MSWIKLHSGLLNWEWLDDSAMVQIWIYILLSANYEDREWRGIVIPRGSFVTSVSHLSHRLCLSMRSVRTCLNRLKTTNEVTIKTTNKYTMISVCKYEDYQFIKNSNDKQNDIRDDKRKTNKRQTNDKQTTTTTECIESKECTYGKKDDNSCELSKKENSIPANDRENAFNVWAQKSIPSVQKMKEPLTLSQFDKLSSKFGKQLLLEVLMAMDNNLALLKRYKSANKTAIGWLKRRLPEQKSKVEETMTAMQRVDRLYENKNLL